MKKVTASFLMALGLALPAVTMAQNEKPDRDREEGAPRREHADRAEPGKQGDRGDGERPPHMQRRDGDRELGRREDDRRDGDRDVRPMGRPFRGGRGPMGPGRPGMGRGIPPFFAALDRNQDGVLSRKEIDRASEALRRLDRNGDGEVTLNELRPGGPGREDGPPMRRQMRGQRGFGGPGGDREPGSPAHRGEDRRDDGPRRGERDVDHHRE